MHSYHKSNRYSLKEKHYITSENSRRIEREGERELSVYFLVWRQIHMLTAQQSTEWLTLNRISFLICMITIDIHMHIYTRRLFIHMMHWLRERVLLLLLFVGLKCTSPECAVVVVVVNDTKKGTNVIALYVLDTKCTRYTYQNGFSIRAQISYTAFFFLNKCFRTNRVYNFFLFRFSFCSNLLCLLVRN